MKKLLLLLLIPLVISCDAVTEEIEDGDYIVVEIKTTYVYRVEGGSAAYVTSDSKVISEEIIKSSNWKFKNYD